MPARYRATNANLTVPLLIIAVGLTFLMLLNFYPIDEHCDVEESHIHVEEEKKQSDCAYLFLLSSNAFFPCLAVAIHSLQETGTTQDIVIMITPNVWEHIDKHIETLGAIPIRIEAVKNPNRSVKRNHLRDNFTKLRAWQLSQYEKVIYTDSDFIYTRNSDDLCHLPAPVNAGRNFNSKEGDWLDESFFNAGFMVITPGADIFCDMVIKSGHFFSPTGGDQPFQNEYWKNKWEEIDYKYDGANANIFFTRPEEWNRDYIRSIHFTRATNPCNHHFEDEIQEHWDNFAAHGRPVDYNPLVLWLEAKESLIETYPEFTELFNQCGFMQGWDDGGKAFDKDLHPLGFI